MKDGDIRVNQQQSDAVADAVAEDLEKDGARRRPAVSSVSPSLTEKDNAAMAHSTPTADPDPPYTAFTIKEQHTIFVLAASAVLSSPLAAIVYLPLVPRLADHFSVSLQAINLTITVYVIFQAFAPLLLSTHSDTLGRRPVFLACFTIFALASLGISLNKDSYAALIVLRAIQSLGASAVYSVTSGIIADLRPSKTRGKVMGTVLAFSNLGTAIGPVIGGAIAYSHASLWWTFWVMFIFSATMLLALALLFPETARHIVGNGSVRDNSWMSRPLLNVLLKKRSVVTSQPTKRHLAWKSPFKAITIARHPDVALILWIVSFYYALWYTVQASIPVIFEAEPYNFNELEIGLSYLPGAAGVVFGMYFTGRMMNRNYKLYEDRQTEQSQSHDIPPSEIANEANPNDKHAITNFPIERARAHNSTYVTALAAAITIAYGWLIQLRVHPAAPLLFQAIMGFLSTWMFNSFSTLLVDVVPEAPSTAATAGNLARCALAAAAVAVLDPLTAATNRAWFFFIMACLSGIFGLGAVLVLERYGMGWRQDRARKEQRRRDARAEELGEG